MEPVPGQTIQIAVHNGKLPIEDATIYRGFAWVKADWTPDLYPITHVATGYGAGWATSEESARRMVDAYHEAWDGWDTLTEVTDENRPTLKAVMQPTYRRLVAEGWAYQG